MEVERQRGALEPVGVHNQHQGDHVVGERLQEVFSPGLPEHQVRDGLRDR